MLTRLSKRLSREDPSFEAPSAEQALRDNPYMPPEDLVQLIVNEDEEISLYAVRLHLPLDSECKSAD